MGIYMTPFTLGYDVDLLSISALLQQLSNKNRNLKPNSRGVHFRVHLYWIKEPTITFANVAKHDERDLLTLFARPYQGCRKDVVGVWLLFIKQQPRHRNFNTGNSTQDFQLFRGNRNHRHHHLRIGAIRYCHLTSQQIVNLDKVRQSNQRLLTIKYENFELFEISPEHRQFTGCLYKEYVIKGTYVVSTN